MKSNLSVALLALSVASTALAEGLTNPPLGLRFLPLKAVYHLNEPVKGFILVENLSSEPMRIPSDLRPFCGYLMTWTRRPDGRVEQWECAMVEDFGGSIEQTVLIPAGKVYGTSAGFQPDTAGIWGFRASFVSPSGPHPNMHHGDYSTPWVSIEVTK